MRPVVKSGVQRAFDQQRAKACAVDEQIAFDPAVTVEAERGDVSGDTVNLDVCDLSFDPPRTFTFGNFPQEGTVARRIQLIGVVHAIFGQMRELAFLRGFQLEAIFFVTMRVPLG